MTELIQLNDWMKATVDAAAEFARATLDAELEPVDNGSTLPPELTGCFVALIGDAGSLQIGLASNPVGCQTLAKALFASEDEMPDEDVSDALGEIANIIAGGVKKRMSALQPPLAIGLPIVMDGHVRLAERQKILGNDVRLGEVPVRLLIIGNK